MATAPVADRAPITISLDWPDKVLHPNARPHFMALARAKKEALASAFWATRLALGRRKFTHDGKSDILLRQIAHPPDKRDRDRDGIDASLKAARDGIAHALNVNDKHFRPTGIEWGAPIKGGRIIVEIDA